VKAKKERIKYTKVPKDVLLMSGNDADYDQHMMESVAITRAKTCMF